jgi:hypothetical protein
MNGYVLYTYFGRIIERLPLNDRELAVHTQEAAVEKALQLEKNGVTCWIRTY